MIQELSLDLGLEVLEMIEEVGGGGELDEGQIDLSFYDDILDRGQDGYAWLEMSYRHMVTPWEDRFVFIN